MDILLIINDSGLEIVLHVSWTCVSILIDIYMNIELLLYKVSLISPNNFPKGMQQVTLPPSINKNFISSPKIRSISILLYFSNSSGYRVAFSISLFFHFPDGEKHWASFHVINHSDDLYWKYLSESLASFFIGLSILMSLVWNISFRILNIMHMCVCAQTHIYIAINSSPYDVPFLTLNSVLRETECLNFSLCHTQLTVYLWVCLYMYSILCSTKQCIFMPILHYLFTLEFHEN